VSRKRVARLMGQQGLVAPNILERDFSPGQPK
jgi:putative transposase